MGPNSTLTLNGLIRGQDALESSSGRGRQDPLPTGLTARNTLRWGGRGRQDPLPTGPHSHQAHKVVGPQAGIQSRVLGKTSKTVTCPMSVRSG